MKHYGDITKINGAAVEPVNVIIGGSPCQDLSVAGKQAGLAGERSGLFMEPLRVIKEMREADLRRGRTANNLRPRFMVWENVPGAFSANKGADFAAVLQETAKVVCRETPAIPVPKGGWPAAGCLVGVGGEWSIAWRVFDAQFWGVPQRRKRIALVADFGGKCAPEILFERGGLYGDIEAGEKPRKDPAGNSQNSIDTAGGTGRSGCFCIQGNCIDRADTAGCNGKGRTEDVSYTLNTIDRPVVVYDGESITCPTSRSNPALGDPCHTLAATGAGRALLITSPPPLLIFKPGAAARLGGNVWGNEVAPALLAEFSDNIPPVCLENHPQDSRVSHAKDNIVQTLSAQMGTGGGNVPLIMERKDRAK